MIFVFSREKSNQSSRIRFGSLRDDNSSEQQELYAGPFFISRGQLYKNRMFVSWRELG